MHYVNLAFVTWKYRFVKFLYWLSHKIPTRRALYDQEKECELKHNEKTTWWNLSFIQIFDLVDIPEDNYGSGSASSLRSYFTPIHCYSFVGNMASILEVDDSMGHTFIQVSILFYFYFICMYVYDTYTHSHIHLITRIHNYKYSHRSWLVNLYKISGVAKHSIKSF